MGVDGIRDRFSLGREQDGQLSDKLLTALTILLSLLVFVAEPRLRCMKFSKWPKTEVPRCPRFWSRSDGKRTTSRHRGIDADEPKRQFATVK